MKTSVDSSAFGGIPPAPQTEEEEEIRDAGNENDKVLYHVQILYNAVCYEFI
jgi:hypothetical protein